jgi:hypothetical protein
LKNGLVVIDMVGLTNPKYRSRSEKLTRPYPRNPKRMLTSNTMMTVECFEGRLPSNRLVLFLTTVSGSHLGKRRHASLGILGREQNFALLCAGATPSTHPTRHDAPIYCGHPVSSA